MSNLLARLSNSHASLKREIEETAAMLAPLVRRAEQEEARTKRPKYKIFDGVTCVFPECRSNADNRPPEHKAYFEKSGGCLACTMCGYQQPGSQIMIQAEERRNFDDGPDHRRTERVLDDETGGTSAPAALKHASRLTGATAPGKNKAETAKERAIKDRERRYKTCIRELADEIVAFSQPMLNLAMMHAHNLASAVSDHRDCCTVAGCHLLKTPQDAMLIAAALVRKAAAYYNKNIAINDLSGTYLQAVNRQYRMKHVDKACNVVDGLINGYELGGTYSCMAPNVQISAGEPTNKLLKYTEPVQRICEGLELPYSTQRRATDNVTVWFAKGLGGNTPAVVAGAAVWSVVKKEGTSIEAVAEAAGCAADTIKRVLRTL